jgi:hypothetical protein
MFLMDAYFKTFSHKIYREWWTGEICVANVNPGLSEHHVITDSNIYTDVTKYFVFGCTWWMLFHDAHYLVSTYSLTYPIVDTIWKCTLWNYDLFYHFLYFSVLCFFFFVFVLCLVPTTSSIVDFAFFSLTFISY